MNNITLLLFITSTAVENFQKHDQVITPMLEDNLFYKINNILQDISNSLFTTLKMNKHFKETGKPKLLQTMLDNLRVIAENNFKLYQEVENTTKLCRNNKTINSLFNMSELIEEIFENNNLISLNSSSNLKNNFFRIENGLNNEAFTEDIATSDIFNAFIKYFFNKINDTSDLNNTLTTPLDIIQTQIDKKSTMNFRRMNKKKSSKRKYYQLKSWAPQNSSELTDPSKTRRIFNGVVTNINRYAFMASIHIAGEFVCAGCIISHNLVLTAAACMNLAYPDKVHKPDIVYVRVGSDFTRNEGELIPSTDVFFHPKYDGKFLKHNIAIIKILKHLTFNKNNKKLRRIINDKTESDIPLSSSVTILGWGDRGSSNKYTGALNRANLELYKLKNCKQVYAKKFVTKYHFCAGFVKKGGGACNRDLGGPGIIGDKLMGIISFGPPTCGSPDAPTVFTRLGFYSDWIDSIIENSTQQQQSIIVKNSSPVEKPGVRQPTFLENLGLNLQSSKTPKTTQNNQQDKKANMSSFQNSANLLNMVNLPNTQGLTETEIISNLQQLQVLKSLFKDLILSGKLNIHELIQINEGTEQRSNQGLDQIPDANTIQFHFKDLVPTTGMTPFYNLNNMIEPLLSGTNIKLKAQSYKPSVKPTLKSTTTTPYNTPESSSDESDKSDDPKIIDFQEKARTLAKYLDDSSGDSDLQSLVKRSRQSIEEGIKNLYRSNKFRK